MDIQPTSTSESGELRLELDRTSLGLLYETANWGTFMAILGFIFSAFFLLTSIFIFSADSRGNFPFPFPIYVVGIIYVVGGLLYLFPSYYLYQFSNKAKRAIQLRSSESIPGAMENLKSLFKFMGITSIAVIAFYILMIIVIMTVGAGAMMGSGVNA